MFTTPRSTRRQRASRTLQHFAPFQTLGKHSASTTTTPLPHHLPHTSKTLSLQARFLAHSQGPSGIVLLENASPNARWDRPYMPCAQRCRPPEHAAFHIRWPVRAINPGLPGVQITSSVVNDAYIRVVTLRTWQHPSATLKVQY